jgi:hypothetical protein
MSASGGTPMDGGGIAGSGVAPTGGTGGAAGGRAGAGGAGGAPADPCAFGVDHAQSEAISTVEIVTWTVGLPNLTEAHIDFGPAGAPTTRAPVNLQGPSLDPSHRTLLLGMKAERSCTFRIVATDGATSCTSADFSFTTGALPSNAPTITKPASGAGGAQGFIVTTTGLDLGAISAGQPNAYVFDTDGDVVWWSSTALKETNNNGISRAHMSWDGTEMWVVSTADGHLESITMDGMTTIDHAELRYADHDFTVLPEGGLGVIFHPQSTGGPYSFVEWQPDGTVIPIVPDLGALYTPGSSFHPNAVHYYQSDDSYSLSDLAGSLFVKFKRNGELIWQLGGGNPLGKSFTLVGLAPWNSNHGHHLTPDGHFLFFNNGGGVGSQATIFDLLLDETAGTATKTWQYQFTGASSPFLGDVQRLPNGNALVTYSMSGVIQEVDPSGSVVQSWNGTTFGYTDFRTSLYGPPLR